MYTYFQVNVFVFGGRCEEVKLLSFMGVLVLFLGVISMLVIIEIESEDILTNSE